MNSQTFVINKLKSNTTVNQILSYMKDKGGCYIAGGALTCIASGKHDEINDYDFYFPSVEAAVEAIRYMKEYNTHVTFVSDKSISYQKDGIDIQFIYTDFYPKAIDIFEHFDFTVNMVAYDCRDNSLTTHENFWLHLSQRYLSINTKTKFPIITNLRIDKYKQRGFKTSRTQMVKLSLAISSLNINSWEEAKAQMGNTYGLTLADFNNIKNTPFNLEALFECIDRISEDVGCNNIPMQSDYLYPHDAVDFVLLGKPIDYININGIKTYVDRNALGCSSSLDTLIVDGVLEGKEVNLEEHIKDKSYYCVSSSTEEQVKAKIGGYWNVHLNTKDNLNPSFYDKTNNVYEVAFSVDNVKSFEGGEITLKSKEDVSLKFVCKVFDLKRFKEGDGEGFTPQTIASFTKSQSYSQTGWAYNTNGASMQQRINSVTPERKEFISKHIIVTGGGSGYAHHKFNGVILTGGESITAEELLYHMDGYNLCFGGDIEITADGCFSGRYNTD